MATITWRDSNIATRMLRVLDADRSGGLSRDELATLQKTQTGSGLKTGDLDGYFASRDHADGGSDSQLQHSELRPAGMFSPELLTAMLDELSGQPPQEPGAQSIRSADGTLVTEAQARVFALMDQDGNGGVSTEELQRLSSNGQGDAAAVVASLDLDRDQRLSSRELAGTRLLDSDNLASTLQKLQPGASENAASLNLAEWLLPQIDADGSGDLSVDEYLGLNGGAPDAQTDGRMFRRADVNGDGKLTADEVSGALEGFGGGPIVIAKGDTDQLRQGALQQADSSGDGALDASELNTALGEVGGKALLEDFDGDQDGKLSAAELAAAVALRPDYYQIQGLIGRAEPTEDPKMWKMGMGSAGEQALHGLLWRGLDRQLAALTGADPDTSPLRILDTYGPPYGTAPETNTASSRLAPQTLAGVLDQEEAPTPDLVGPKLDANLATMEKALDALIPTDRDQGRER